ncbi:MAG: hypothetical protein FNT15_09430 [Sulfurovum sp.]|nr:MAG: hypothetical protein FNT15_09430 [Sulfurovum sp.]
MWDKFHAKTDGNNSPIFQIDNSTFVFPQQDTELHKKIDILLQVVQGLKPEDKNEFDRLIEIRDYPSARKVLKLTKDINFDDAINDILLAYIYDKADAFDEIEKNIKNHDNNLEKKIILHFVKIDLLIEDNKIKQAEETIGIVKKLSPCSKLEYMNVDGKIAFRTYGQPVATIEEVEKQYKNMNQDKYKESFMLCISIQYHITLRYVWIHYQRGNLTEGIKELEKAMVYSMFESKDAIYNVYLQLALLYYQLGYYNQSLYYLEKITIEDITMRYGKNLFMCKNYIALGDKEKAKETYQASLDLHAKLPTVPIQMHNKSLINELNEQYSMMIGEYNQALYYNKLCKQDFLNDNFASCYSDYMKAMILIGQNNIKMAQTELEILINQLKDTEYKSLYARSIYNYATFCVEDLHEKEKLIKKALLIQRKLLDNYRISLNLHALSSIYLRMEKYYKANLYFENYVSLIKKRKLNTKIDYHLKYCIKKPLTRNILKLAIWVRVAYKSNRHYDKFDAWFTVGEDYFLWANIIENKFPNHILVMEGYRRSMKAFLKAEALLKPQYIVADFITLYGKLTEINIHLSDDATAKHYYSLLFHIIKKEYKTEINDFETYKAFVRDNRNIMTIQHDGEIYDVSLDLLKDNNKK